MKQFHNHEIKFETINKFALLGNLEEANNCSRIEENEEIVYFDTRGQNGRVGALQV